MIEWIQEKGEEVVNKKVESEERGLRSEGGERRNKRGMCEMTFFCTVTVLYEHYAETELPPPDKRHILISAQIRLLFPLKLQRRSCSPA